MKQCDVSPKACMTPSPSEEFLHSTIDWTRLYNDRHAFFSRFVASLFPGGSPDPFLEARIGSVYDLDVIAIEPVEISKVTPCKDINYAFALRSTAEEPSAYLEKNRTMFHIALHSKYSDHNMRGRYHTCSTLKKKSRGKLSGLFHYKIDAYEKRGRSPMGGLQYFSRSPPHQIFTFNPGTTRLRDTSETGFKCSKKDKEAIDALPSATQTAFLELHKYICKKFIAYWNVNSVAYLRTAGGRYRHQRTNRRRGQRNRTRRSKK